jgi:hypothetical protein
VTSGPAQPRPRAPYAHDAWLAAVARRRVTAPDRSSVEPAPVGCDACVGTRCVHTTAAPPGTAEMSNDTRRIASRSTPTRLARWLRRHDAHTLAIIAAGSPAPDHRGRIHHRAVGFTTAVTTRRSAGSVDPRRHKVAPGVIGSYGKAFSRGACRAQLADTHYVSCVTEQRSGGDSWLGRIVPPQVPQTATPMFSSRPSSGSSSPRCARWPSANASRGNLTESPGGAVGPPAKTVRERTCRRLPARDAAQHGEAWQEWRRGLLRFGCNSSTQINLGVLLGGPRLCRRATGLYQQEKKS